MNGLCIYHGGCTDGVAAAWAVHEAHPDWRFYPGVYQQDPPWALIRESSEVYLVDFSYKQGVMRRIADQCHGPVYVLDHHATAEDDLKPLLAEGVLHGQFDMERCGALMAWDWFHEQPRPPLMAYIDARDRWVMNDVVLEHVLDHVIMALRSYSHDMPLQFDLWGELMEAPALLAAEGIAIHRYYRILVEDAKGRAQLVTLGPYQNVPCANAPYNLASEVAGELAKDSPDGLAFVWWQNSDGSYTTSLRSRDGGPHVGNLAIQWGGGGHPEAAGFRCDQPVWTRCAW